MPFRFSAKSVFLTYPQCSVTKEDALSHLQSILPIEQYIVARELHEDGHPHLHAVLTFHSKFHSLEPRVFDLPPSFHPNVQNPRSLRASKDYCSKGGDYIASPDFLERCDANLSSLLLSSNSKKEYLAAVLSTKANANRFIVAQAIARHVYDDVLGDYVPEFPTTSFRPPLEVSAWATGTIGQGHSRPRGLLLWSVGSGLGKTEWARSLGRHIYWCMQKDLKLWDDDAQFLIMDDIEWDFVPDKKGFFGSQKEFSTTDKYKGKRTLKWGKPLIFLCNYDPTICPGWNQWYDERMLVVKITNKMF